MDSNRFDALTQRFFAGPSRRGLLRTFLGSAVTGAGVASVGFPMADASKRKRKRKRKRKGKRKKKPSTPTCQAGARLCGEECIPSGDCCTDDDCGAQRCCNGTCAGCCDNAHCGAGETCVDGTCACPGEEEICGDVCIDLATDGANCGACGNECTSGTCVHGACACTSDADCPANCSLCRSRLQGGNACLDSFDGFGRCADDDDCPVGSFCGDTGTALGPLCSNLCGE
jgi:hypothetical protein